MREPQSMPGFGGSTFHFGVLTPSNRRTPKINGPGGSSCPLDCPLPSVAGCLQLVHAAARAQVSAGQLVSVERRIDCAERDGRDFQDQPVSRDGSLNGNLGFSTPAS